MFAYIAFTGSDWQERSDLWPMLMERLITVIEKCALFPAIIYRIAALFWLENGFDR